MELRSKWTIHVWTTAFGEHGGDGVGEALETIDDGEHDILSAAVLDLVHGAQPELGAFILFDPHAENFLAAIAAHAQRNVDRLRADQALVANLHPDRVEEHQRIGGIERALLPGRDFLEHGVGDGRDQVRRDVNAVEFAQMPRDLPRAHAACIHRYDLVVEARKATLVLRNQLRIEAALPVARHLNGNLAGVGYNRLATVAIATVPGLSLVAKVMIHLGVECPFGQRLLQRIQ